MIGGFADRRLYPLGYARFLNLARTTGLEPAIFSLKGWRLNRFAYVLEMRVKRFELLHKLGLSQSPLPLGYTRPKKINTRGKI